MFRKTYKNMNQKLSPDKWLQSEMVKNMEAYREGGARPQLRAKSRTAAILTGALAVCLLVVAIGFTPMVRGFLFGPDALLTQAFGAQEEEDDFNEQALAVLNSGQLTPLSATQEKNGLELNFLGYQSSQRCLSLYYTLRDTAGQNRLAGQMYQMIEITINKNKGVWSGGNVPAFYVLDYDEDTQTATCRADIMDLGEEEFPMEGAKVQFSLEGLNVLQEECAYAPLDLDENQFTQETLPIELYYDNNHSFGEADIVEIDKALNPAREEEGLLYTGMGLSLDSYLDENGDPVVLKPGELQELPMTDPADLSLSAVGFIDDQLTIQLKSGWQMPGTDVEVVCVPAGQGRKISRQIQRDTNSGQLRMRSVDALLLVGNQRNTNLGFALGESGDVKDKVVLGGNGYWETRFQVSPDELDDYDFFVRWMTNTYVEADLSATISLGDSLPGGTNYYDSVEIGDMKVDWIAATPLGVVVAGPQHERYGGIGKVRSLELVCGGKAVPFRYQENAAHGNALLSENTGNSSSFGGTAGDAWPYNNYSAASSTFFAKGEPADLSKLTAIRIDGKEVPLTPITREEMEGKQKAVYFLENSDFQALEAWPWALQLSDGIPLEEAKAIRQVEFRLAGGRSLLYNLEGHLDEYLVAYQDETKDRKKEVHKESVSLKFTVNNQPIDPRTVAAIMIDGKEIPIGSPWEQETFEPLGKFENLRSSGLRFGTLLIEEDKISIYDCDPYYQGETLKTFALTDRSGVVFQIDLTGDDWTEYVGAWGGCPEDAQDMNTKERLNRYRDQLDSVCWTFPVDHKLDADSLVTMIVNGEEVPLHQWTFQPVQVGGLDIASMEANAQGAVLHTKAPIDLQELELVAGDKTYLLKRGDAASSDGNLMNVSFYTEDTPLRADKLTAIRVGGQEAALKGTKVSAALSPDILNQPLPSKDRAKEPNASYGSLTAGETTIGSILLYPNSIEVKGVKGKELEQLGVKLQENQQKYLVWDTTKEQEDQELWWIGDFSPAGGEVESNYSFHLPEQYCGGKAILALTVNGQEVSLEGAKPKDRAGEPPLAVYHDIRYGADGLTIDQVELFEDSIQLTGVHHSGIAEDSGQPALLTHFGVCFDITEQAEQLGFDLTPDSPYLLIWEGKGDDPSTMSSSNWSFPLPEEFKGKDRLACFNVNDTWNIPAYLATYGPVELDGHTIDTITIEPHQVRLRGYWQMEEAKELEKLVLVCGDEEITFSKPYYDHINGAELGTVFLNPVCQESCIPMKFTALKLGNEELSFRQIAYLGDAPG